MRKIYDESNDSTQVGFVRNCGMHVHIVRLIRRCHNDISQKHYYLLHLNQYTVRLIYI